MLQQLTIEYPDTFPDILQESRSQFEEEARLAMALKLFELKRLSSGHAAQLAGMSRTSFLLMLHRFGIPMIDLESDELEQDIANA